jgi:hypothetical protein
MPKDLDEIFATYDQRKLAEQNAANERAEKERAERDVTGSLFTSVVLPALKELVAQVKAKGHKATLHEYIENYTAPRVTVEFTPVPKVQVGHRTTFIQPSKLTFTHTGGGLVTVAKEVKSKSDADTSYDHRSAGESTIKAEQVTHDWVRTQALGFIDAVLKAN